METKEILKAIFGWSMFLLFSPFVLIGVLAYLIKIYIFCGYMIAEVTAEEF